jgi:hypothetical protein
MGQERQAELPEAASTSGRIFVVTDNDGLDDWSGEAWFFGLGRYWALFD